MADAPAKRSMDDFLINPTTINMDDHYTYSYDPSLEYPSIPLPLIAPREIFALKSDQKRPEHSAELNTTAYDHAFWRDYTSEEEVASPIEHDDYSIGSWNSDIDSASILEEAYHAQTCENARQLDLKAHAVPVVSAGKARLVTVPKVIEPSFARQIVRSPSKSTPHLVSKRISTHDGVNRVDASTASSRTSGEKSYDSLTPSPPLIRTVQFGSVRRRPKLSRLQIQPSPEPAQWLSSTSKTELAMQNASHLIHDPIPSDVPAPAAMMSSTTPRRRMPKFSSSLSLRGIGKGFRRSTGSTSSSNEDLNSAKQPNRLKKAPVISDMHVPSRTSSKPLPKMIPRGANERAPPIVLPPYPDEDEDEEEEEEEDDILSAPQWPGRNASVAALGRLEPRTEVAKLHSRRKSLSAFVSAQT